MELWVVRLHGTAMIGVYMLALMSAITRRSKRREADDMKRG